MEPLLTQELVKGDEWCLVDCKWFRQWKKYTGYDDMDQTSTGKENANPGPIHNADLFQNQICDKLMDHLLEEVNYSLIPKPAYDILVSWYGLSMSSRHICRYVVEFGTHVECLQVEVYLCDLSLCTYPNINDNEAKSFSFSRADTIEKIQNKIIEIFEVPSGSETRVWLQHYMFIDTYDLLSNVDQTLSDADINDGQLIMLEIKDKNGQWPSGIRQINEHIRTKVEPVQKPLMDGGVVFESAIIRRSTLIGNLFKKFTTEFLALQEDGAILRSFKDHKKISTNLTYSMTNCTSVVIRSDAHKYAGWPADIAVERCFVLNNSKNSLVYFIAETPELAKEWIEKLEEARQKHYVESSMKSEQTAVRDYEYTEQKKEDHETTYEQKLAKEYGLTIEEYQAQKELLDQANKERDLKNEQKLTHQPNIPIDPPIEEGTATTCSSGPAAIEDSVALVTTGHPLSNERMEEERKTLERIKSQVDDQPPLFHEYESIPGLIQQRVIEDQFKGSTKINASVSSSYGNSPPVYQNIPVGEIQASAINHGHRSPKMTNRENHSSLPSILNDRQPSAPVSSSSPLNIRIHVEDEFATVVIPTQGGNDPLRGVLKWIGNLPDVPGLIAGVELNNEIAGCTDGTWKGSRFFKSSNGRGYFCPLKSLEQDNVAFIDKGHSQVTGPIIENMETNTELPKISFKSLKTLVTQQEMEASKVLQQLVQQLMSAVDTLETENETTAGRHEEQIKKLTTEKEELVKYLMDKEKEIEALQLEKERESTKLTKNFENEKKNLEEEKASLERKNATLEGEKRKLEQEKEMLEQNRSNFEDEKAIMEGEKTTLRGTLRDVQEKNQNLENVNQLLRDIQQNMQEKNRQFQVEQQEEIQIIQEKNQQLQDEKQKLQGHAEPTTSRYTTCASK